MRNEVKLEVGKEYEINHCRKGRFSVFIETVNDDYVGGVITKGTASALMDYNIKRVGDKITFMLDHVDRAHCKTATQGAV